MIRAGKLRHRLTLEAPERTPGEGGTASTTWTVAATVWGEIVPIAASETVEGDARSGRVTHEITIRWRAGLDTSQRFKRGTGVFDIIGVRDPAEDRRRLVCRVIERTP